MAKYVVPERKETFGQFPTEACQPAVTHPTLRICSWKRHPLNGGGLLRPLSDLHGIPKDHLHLLEGIDLGWCYHNYVLQKKVENLIMKRFFTSRARALNSCFCLTMREVSRFGLRLKEV